MHDADEFAALYELEAETVLLFVTRRTLDAEVALDITAETFAQAFRGRRGFRGTTRPEQRAWLFTIARRQIGRYLRRGPRRAARVAASSAQTVPTMHEDDLRAIEEAAQLAELRAALGAELDRLSVNQREALRLRVVEERPYDEVALVLGISEQTARTASRAACGRSRRRSSRVRWRDAHEPAAEDPRRARPASSCALPARRRRTARRGAVRARTPRAFVIGLLALLGLAAAATAATLIIGRGDPIPPARSGDVPLELRPVAGSARLNGLDVADPDGGPLWDVRTSRSRTGAVCTTVGQVLDGELGLVGLDRRFRALPAGAADTCSTPQRRGATLAGARAFRGGGKLTALTVVNGVAAPAVRGATAVAGGRTVRMRLGPGHAFLAVFRGLPERYARASC